MSIEVVTLEKRFKDFHAVDSVSFRVRDGEFVSLLGPSGSGKSTILRCIAGLEKPDGGTILVNKEDVTHISVQDRKVGFVFQHYALFKHMTVLDNIAFGLKVRGVSKAERLERAKELVRLFELLGIEDRFPTQLSGGQRQRVALARALAPEPGLLLLDEPFGALDAKLRKDLRVWLKKLHDRIQLTTLMVTHDQEEALELSDRILVVNKGKIEQDSSPLEIFNKPQTEFVATFVGEANKVEGVVQNGKVMWGPLQFSAPHLKNGIRASVLFRPNDVYVSSKSEDGGSAGVISSVQFLGATESLEIRFDENFSVVAHVPKGVSDQSHFVPGKNVFVNVTTAHVFESSKISSN